VHCSSETLILHLYLNSDVPCDHIYHVSKFVRFCDSIKQPDKKGKNYYKFMRSLFDNEVYVKFFDIKTV
jgi:hypothetical protein